MKAVKKLKLEHFGPISCAEVEFGDLTVFVGPQASGKSIFLQLLRLVLDTGYIHDQLRKHGIEWGKSVPNFLDVYLGEGMRRLWTRNGTKVTVDDEIRPLPDWVIVRRRRSDPTVFYIPAQRVLSLANGWPRPFQSFATEDPFVVRDFSETFRLLLEREFSQIGDLFPKTNRLKGEYRELLAENVFGGFTLSVDRHGAQKRLVLTRAGERRNRLSKPISFMAWSAGQREFVPLLMGLYWLMPPSKTPRRGDLKWVVIEEPEMGLHPRAISVVMLLILDLLGRGYRVCLSTHSPHVLDLLWALRAFKEYRASPQDVLELFEVRQTRAMKELASKVLSLGARVYYFEQGKAHDISKLDPASEWTCEAGWGGLTEFSGRVTDVVSRVVGDHLFTSVPGR